MPLRDHFRTPISRRESWEGVHSLWPGMIVQYLNPILAPRYFAIPQVHLGSIEIDVSTYEADHNSSFPRNDSDGLSPWSPPEPTAILDCLAANPAEYEVLIYDADRNERLVAAIELISPANKDRPEHRRAFVRKCVELLHANVSLVLVDVVTTRTTNLYSALWTELNDAEPTRDLPDQFAVSLKPTRHDDRLSIRCWERVLTVGSILPSMPLWLDDRFSIPLDLESSYVATCRALGIA